MLNKTGESGHPCLVPDLRGNAFSFSLLSIMLAVGWSYIAFIMLRYVLSSLLRVFNHKWMLNLAKYFLYIYWDDHMIFTLHSLNAIYQNWFADLNNLYIHWLNPTWSWHTIIFHIVGFDLIFCWGFLKQFSSGVLACNFLFLQCSCLVLVSV